MERLKPRCAAPATIPRASGPRRVPRGAIFAVIVCVLLVAPSLASAQTVPPTTPPTNPPTTPTSGPTTTLAPTTTTTTTPTPTEPSTSTSTVPSSTTTAPEGPTTTQPPGSPALNDPSILDALKAGSGELTTDELDLLQRFLDAQGRVNAITDDLIKINEQYLSSQQDMLDAISRVADADDRLRRSSDQLATAQAELDRQRRQLQEDAVSSYVGGGRSMAQVRAMMKAETVDDLSKSRIYASAVAEDEQQLVDLYKELRRQVDELRRQADQDRNDATEARDGLAARQSALDQQRQDLLATREKEQGSVEEKVKLLAEVEASKGDYLRRYYERQTSGGDIGARLKQLQAGEILPPNTNGTLRQPLQSYRLTQPFGCKTNPLYGTNSCHPGLDMAAPSGTPLYASADGTVVMAQWYDGYGLCVVIRHDNGLATLYAHQSALAVQEGDRVAAGQVIGYVGSTGNSTGPHVHWEVRVFGDVKDPVPFMRPI